MLATTARQGGRDDLLMKPEPPCALDEFRRADLRSVPMSPWHGLARSSSRPRSRRRPLHPCPPSCRDLGELRAAWLIASPDADAFVAATVQYSGRGVPTPAPHGQCAARAATMMADAARRRPPPDSIAKVSAVGRRCDPVGAPPKPTMARTARGLSQLGRAISSVGVG